MGMATLAMAFVLALLGKLTAEFSAIATIVNGAFNAADTFITRSFAGKPSTGEDTEGKL